MKTAPVNSKAIHSRFAFFSYRGTVSLVKAANG
jgi:hypothetical protein